MPRGLAAGRRGRDPLEPSPPPRPPPTATRLLFLVAPRPGDLVLTGTPSGVGRLLPGDKIAAGVAGHTEMAVAVVAG